ncbi:hypothetical protein J7T55_002813 [Diaporthe amygdali]|uniref:uncharacterized protein n=1 Tax=Phomopsis amygdali TaxID=1214568 RepID=UPI0022FF2CEE|nr:uncharacterized protein J7T55_002813 [Diaporthe amygdali]KAJ0122300.1 hypothetical protein J7T55_002813 [Diaporthe amygdali]
MKAASKPKFQPVAGRTTLSGRITKQDRYASQKSHSFLSALTFRPKQDSPVVQTQIANQANECPSQNADSPNNTLPSPVKQVSPIVDLSVAMQAINLLSETKKKYPFKLRKAIPKAGFRFPGETKGKRSILGRWENENKVAWALCADMNHIDDMENIDKNVVQKVVSPVFYKAAEMIENGYLWGLTRREDITRGEGRRIWKRFLAKLWVESPMKWPQRLTQKQFSQFVSSLAEAHWAWILQPRTDGREHGLLAKQISLFLQAADEADFPWANGGDVFLADEEDNEELDHEEQDCDEQDYDEQDYEAHDQEE